MEAAKKAQEVAKRAAIPLYEKVMPLLQEVESDLEPADIDVDYEPFLHFVRSDDKRYLLFQLKPKSGIRTSVYRVAYNTKTQHILKFGQSGCRLLRGSGSEKVFAFFAAASAAMPRTLAILEAMQI